MAKRKRSPKEDPQQYEVYDMENDFIGPKQAQLTKRAMRELAEAVTSAFRIPPVKLEFKKLGPWAALCHTDGRVIIGTKWSSQQVVTLLHELAHHLHNTITKKALEQEAHGPEWVACYIVVLDVARVLPVVASRAICKKHKIKFIDPGEDRSVARLAKLIA